MKKTLIALAALASTAAFAQSSVTISGRLDLGHGNVKKTEAGVTTKTSSLAGDEGTRTGGRITFAGVEDLGGGLKASFNYEARLSADRVGSAEPGIGGTRNAFLNLSGGFGGVTIGTYLNPLDAVRGFSAGTAGAPGGDFLANHINVIGQFVTEAELTTQLQSGGLSAANAAAAAKTALTLAHNGISGRSTNSIGYTSPSFGGVTAGFGVSQQKTSTADTALNKVDGVIGTVAYAAGPLNARLAIGQGKGSVKSTATNLTSTKTSDTAFAVSYNLGMAVPYIQHEATKLTLQNLNGVALTTGNELKTSATEIGSTFPMGAFTPYVTFGSGKLEFDGEKVKTSAFQVGTTYNLSKRTYVYGAVGQFKLKEVSKTTGYKLGLVHQF